MSLTSIRPRHCTSRNAEIRDCSHDSTGNDSFIIIPHFHDQHEAEAFHIWLCSSSKWKHGKNETLECLGLNLGPRGWEASTNQ